MTRERFTPLGVLAVGILALYLPGFFEVGLPPVARSLIAYTGLFFCPGFLFISACRLTSDIGWLERPAVCFAASLAMLAVATTSVMLLSGSIGQVAPILVGMMCVATGVTLLRAPVPALVYRNGGPRRELILLSMVAMAAIGLTLGAWRYTETGSVDRWWYLAFVRTFLDAEAWSGAEPFLGTGIPFARFTWSPWLSAFATWAKVAAVDSTWLYEHGCVLALAPAAVSAYIFVGRAIFDSWRLALITAASAVLLWTTGGLLPALSRLPEDKLMAAIILAPVLIGAVVRAADAGREGLVILRRRNWFILSAACALTLAVVHPLVYAISLIALLPFLALFAKTNQTKTAVATTLILILFVGGVVAYGLGGSARDAVVATGAALETPDHPVVRVHLNRQRLVNIGFGQIVSPRLIFHPLVLLAFLALLPLIRRPLKQRYILIPATFIALSVAFFPPLTALAGYVVLPWMVYRVFWAIPFALLLAVFVDEVSRVSRLRSSFVVAAMALAVFPLLGHTVSLHEGRARARLAGPEHRQVLDLLAAVETLPADSIVAAPQELSERLPALTGKHVLALSDRGHGCIFR